MPDQNDLNSWLAKVKTATSKAQLFAMLDEFRALDWKDDQRASMARVYIRLLDRLVDDSQQSAPAAASQQAEDQGPVWYEKM